MWTSFTHPYRLLCSSYRKRYTCVDHSTPLENSGQTNWNHECRLLSEEAEEGGFICKQSEDGKMLASVWKDSSLAFSLTTCHNPVQEHISRKIREPFSWLVDIPCALTEHDRETSQIWTDHLPNTTQRLSFLFDRGHVGCAQSESSKLEEEEWKRQEMVVLSVRSIFTNKRWLFSVSDLSSQTRDGCSQCQIYLHKDWFWQYHEGVCRTDTSNGIGQDAATQTEDCSSQITPEVSFSRQPVITTPARLRRSPRKLKLSAWIAWETIRLWQLSCSIDVHTLKSREMCLFMYRLIESLIDYIMGNWLYYQTLCMCTYIITDCLPQSKLVKNKFGKFVLTTRDALMATCSGPQLWNIFHPFDTIFFPFKA